MTDRILALPGFMGLPSDWDFFDLPQFKGVDLYQFGEAGLEEWSDKFAEDADKGTILMGYSFGGRLALHTLIRHPHLFQGAIIISAHPGLSTEKEKQQRLQSDDAWAGRFEKEEWIHLMQSWNGRSAFLPNGFHFQRDENQYNRMKLANMLRWGSLGNQGNLKSEIEKLELPFLWLTGENDETYTRLAQTIKLSNPLSRHVVMAGAGHRCPWEKPQDFVLLIKEFVKACC